MERGKDREDRKGLGTPFVDRSSSRCSLREEGDFPSLKISVTISGSPKLFINIFFTFLIK